MRRKRDTQSWLEYQSSNLKLTNDYFARYEAISLMLDETPRLLDLVHRDLENAVEVENRQRKRRGGFVYTSEMVLRLELCQLIEGLSLREVVVRVDDGNFLRRFTRIYGGPMMNYSVLCKLRNAIKPETWEEVNRELAKTAVERGLITGEELRLDTTAVETNIHWPTDSALLWDSYRKLGTLIAHVREIDPEAVGERRVHLKRAKRTATKIARRLRAKGRRASDVKPLYLDLIRHVEGLSDWSVGLISELEVGLRSNYYNSLDHVAIERLVADLRHFEELAKHVVWQASERVIHERPVSNEDKLFSIFEPHTELLIRGKAGKDIEFGHMVEIEQVKSKFITRYAVFQKKPAEPALVALALDHHEALFGHLPESLAADKGYWSSSIFEDAEERVPIVSIPKKGRRNSAEEEREHDPLFRMAQRFRAGIEGSISFLKRILRLARCMNKGWEHYVATVGATVFAHNLLVLARC